MSSAESDPRQVFADGAIEELDSALEVIAHCLQQLDNAQCWSRPDPSMNSIGNLLLHLSGNIRQWIISGVGGTTDMRERQAEFDAREGPEKDELYKQLAATVDEAKGVLQQVDAEDLARSRRVQGFEVTGLSAALHSIAHFRGHTQEIVHMTRRLAGEDYQFAFVPSKEQGGV